MSRKQNAETHAAPTAKKRGGRPPASMAGEVDARLLDAAKELFLARGYEATSCDQVAALAGAGKASLYARYANKQALFMAVVARNVDSTLGWDGEAPGGKTAVERLQSVGEAVLEHCLRPDVVAMMRMLIETAPRFPDLAYKTHQIGREAGIARVVEAVLPIGDVSEDVLARARHCAECFVEFIFAPQQMSALLGTSRSELTTASRSRVSRAVELLKAAGYCEGLD